MNIPQQKYLTNQTFNSEFIEFVWQFPLATEQKNQIVFKVCDNGLTTVQEGVVDGFGDDVGMHYFTLGTKITNNLSQEELSSLKNEVLEFLK